MVVCQPGSCENGEIEATRTECTLSTSGRGEGREDEVGALEAVPVARRAGPAKGQQAVNVIFHFAGPRSRNVARSGIIPVYQKSSDTSYVGADGETRPQQRLRGSWATWPSGFGIGKHQ